MRYVNFCLLAVGTVLLAGSASAITISVDPDKTPIKDQRNSSAGPGVGFAGAVLDMNQNFIKEFIVNQPEKTWETLKAGGGYVTREWSANDRWQARRAPFVFDNPKDRKKAMKWCGWTDEHDWNYLCYDFRKKHGMRTTLTLENYSVVVDYKTGERSNKIEDVRRVILEFVQWIIDNGFKDQVIGFELGNEPYFGSDPENFAERWGEIVPDIVKMWPGVNIGFTIAEYREGDPDVAAVRRRSTAVDKWFQGGSYFGFSKLNQWSGRFIVAASNYLHMCNHVIYHFYGGDVCDGLGPMGFARIHNFARAFPEIADRRVWITEWRERSDEDDRCQQMHSSTITKAHYNLAAVGAPMFDSTHLHNMTSIAGAFSITDGNGKWYVQWDPAGSDFTDPDYTRRPRIEVGPCGPMFQIYNEALMDHPIILEHGGWDGPRDAEKSWTGIMYYGYTHSLEGWHLGGEKGERPKSRGGPQWVCSKSPDGKSISVIFCQSAESDWDVAFSFPGYGFAGKAKYRLFRCDPEKQQLHQIPGEPTHTWREEFEAEPNSYVIPPLTIGSIIFPIEKAEAVIGFMTDSHVTGDTSSCVRVELAHKLFRDKGADAVFHAGDIADVFNPKAYRNYKAVTDGVYTNGRPAEVFSMAFHDTLGYKSADGWDKREDAWKEIRDLLGVKHEMYDIFEVKGFVFAVAPEWPDKAKYEQLIEKAVKKAGKNRPVFVVQHRPPAGTSAKSDEFGNPDSYVRDDLTTLTRSFLDRYPNLVVFSGHVHADARDTRSIWQGPFTAVSCGCLNTTWENYVANADDVFSSSNVLVMSLLKDQMVISRYDITTGKIVGDDWKVPYGYDPSQAKYAPEKVFTKKHHEWSNWGPKVIPMKNGGAEVSIQMPNTHGAFNIGYRCRFELQKDVNFEEDEEEDARFSTKKHVAKWETVSIQDVAGNWRVPGRIVHWANKGAVKAHFSGALFRPAEKVRIVVSNMDFDGFTDKPLVFEGCMPNKDLGKIWKLIWQGGVKGEKVAAWPYGEKFALPEDALEGEPGEKFRVSFTVETDKDAMFAMLADGRQLKGGYTVLGGKKLRYAYEFERTEAKEFALYLSRTYAKEMKITDVKIEKQ